MVVVGLKLKVPDPFPVSCLILNAIWVEDDIKLDWLTSVVKVEKTPAKLDEI